MVSRGSAKLWSAQVQWHWRGIDAKTRRRRALDRLPQNREMEAEKVVAPALECYNVGCDPAVGCPPVPPGPTFYLRGRPIGAERLARQLFEGAS